MTLLKITIFTVLVSFVFCSEHCYTVGKDHFFPNWWGGHIALRTSPVIKARIKMDQNMAHYIIPPDQDVQRCQGSWNKLYGASSCAHLHHIDSDRFVWRRSTKCYKIEGKIVKEIPNCPEADKIEIAAYAYDHGEKPFEHQGTLLKQFKTLIDVNKWYRYQINIMSDSTRYTLYSDEGEILETISIDHKTCWLRNWGYMLGFYFGGACPAPSNVSACYEYL